MQLVSTVVFIVAVGGATVSAGVVNSQDYRSLAGLSSDELDVYARDIDVVGSQPLPPPPTDTTYKLVYDEEHPYVDPQTEDQRGPCPGLNTLASHGYLPRSGVATPAQIINAVIEGFNMEYNLATLVTYGGMLVDGNQLTNLLSIGGISPLTGPSPPLPALAGGLNVHGTFEGDASTTRSDGYLGNNHDLNITLFNQLINTMDSFGNGSYNIHAAAEFRYIRIQDSIARNPVFDFGNPRYATGYAESTFPLAFFSNASEPDLEVGTSADNIRSFFLQHKFPAGFHRRGSPFTAGGTILNTIMAAHPVNPGMNTGTVNSYTPIDFLAGESSINCAIYKKVVNKTLALYPNPTDPLRTALAGNLHNFYQPVKSASCAEVFPYS
ncbi:heme-thiolate peroxidase [Auriculariales sp. MPI-PUGE-AT-0066]|nr:heme-thiolate peroxidase [Auriculariales sp. MPI-PUGE-AT-0066]